MSEKTVCSGVLCVNKPSGVTSHDVVNRIRRLYNTKQVGHTGTLDPMASGVLIVLVGRAVKASEYLLSDTKEYIAGIQLGITTDTLDTTGCVISEFSGTVPGTDDLVLALPSFKGVIMQTPPMYSALKIGGKKLYELAREGVEVNRTPRGIEIYSIEYVSAGARENEHIIRIVCSKGTYIRVLCDDIGKKLGCGAVMSSLVRTRNGAFGIGSSVTLEELEDLDIEGRISKLCPLESVFSGLTAIDLPPFFARLARCGNEIYADKIGASLQEGDRVRLYDGGSFFALGEAALYPDGLAIKPLKQFEIR